MHINKLNSLWNYTGNQEYYSTIFKYSTNTLYGVIGLLLPLANRGIIWMFINYIQETHNINLLE